MSYLSLASSIFYFNSLYIPYINSITVAYDCNGVCVSERESLTEYILMSHEDSLIYLCLSEPAGLLCGEKDFHSHFLSPPSPHPHLSITALPDLCYHLDLLRYSALHLQTQTDTYAYAVTDCQIDR